MIWSHASSHALMFHDLNCCLVMSGEKRLVCSKGSKSAIAVFKTSDLQAFRFFSHGIWPHGSLALLVNSRFAVGLC